MEQLENLFSNFYLDGRVYKEAKFINDAWYRFTTEFIEKMELKVDENDFIYIEKVFNDQTNLISDAVEKTYLFKGNDLFVIETVFKENGTVERFNVEIIKNYKVTNIKFEQEANKFLSIKKLDVTTENENFTFEANKVAEKNALLELLNKLN